MRKMSDKENVTLSVSRALIDRAKSLGINLSSTLDRVLRHLVELEGFEDEEVKLAVLLGAMERIQQQTEQQQKVVDELRRSKRVAILIKLLNAKIIESDFDFAKTKEIAKTEIEELRSLMSVILDDAWLQRQIDRVSRM